MSGLVVPAGSPLVQFEVTGWCKGASDGPDDLPFVVWVKRESEPMNCPVSGRGWRVVETGPESITAMTDQDSRLNPGVCLCMGRFVE